MKKVELVLTKNKLSKTINNRLKRGVSFTLLNMCDQNIDDLILSHSIKILDGNCLIGNDPNQFIKDYRDLMGNLSTHLDSRLWWATNIASKNRFTSKIPVLIQQIEACLKAVSGTNDLVIYRLDVSLTSAFKDICDKENVNLSLPNWYINFILFLSRIRRTASHLKSFFLIMYRIFIVRLYYKTRIKIGNNSDITILKTFFYESSINEKNDYRYHDPMFGRLPKFLADKGKLMILTQILGRYRNCIEKINKQSDFIIIPVEYWLSIKSVFGSLVVLLCSRLGKKIPDVLEYRGINVSSVFKLELFKKYNDIPLEQYVYFEMMSECFKSQQINHYIHTYENNPWEKMAVAAIRKVSPHTRIIGFQQSVVPQASVNLFNSNEEIQIMPLPDNIICVGKEPVDIITEYSSKKIKNIKVGCALRYEYLERIKKKKRQGTDCILLALDGLPEVSVMLNYVLRYANKLKNYTIIIRTHPALPWKNIQDNIEFDIDLLSNVTLSSSIPLIDDLNKTDICIYWGSTVSLEATCMGIPIIHYDMRSILSYDPLFRSIYLKWTVTENDSLPEVIETINLLNDKEYTQQANLAKAYIKRYFHPVSDENMSKFLYT